MLIPEKGYYFSPSDMQNEGKSINLIAGRYGYYTVINNELGVFCAKTPVVPELHDVNEGFGLKLPKKIPIALLHQVISFFKLYVDYESNNEVMVQIFWNREEQEYFIEVPTQRVNRVMVDADLDIDVQIKHLQVMQIHSHNVMSAHWSDQDNECEQATMFYAVIGDLANTTPTILTRFACAGQHVEIDPSQIFEYPPVPDEWHEKVTIVGPGGE